MRPEPETETVSITLDNWQEYFSFVDKYDYVYDAEGAITETYYYIYFQLKEEYQDRLVSLNGNVGYEYEFVSHKITSIDKENGTFEDEVSDSGLGGNLLESLREEASTSVGLSPSVNICMGDAYQESERYGTMLGPIYIRDSDYYTNQWIYYPEEINIVRIEGEMVLNK